LTIEELPIMELSWLQILGILLAAVLIHFAGFKFGFKCGFERGARETAKSIERFFADL